MLSTEPSRLLLWVLAFAFVVVVAGAAFVAGRSSASTDAALDPASESVAAPSARGGGPLSPTDEALLGDVQVMSETDYGDSRVLLVCNPGNRGDDEALDAFEFVQLDSANDGQWIISQRSTITEPTRLPDCGACDITETYTVDPGRPVVFGSCLDGGTNGAGTAFVIARPWIHSSALALVLTCGGTRFEEDQGELVLLSHALKAGSAEPTFPYPEIRFEHFPTGGFSPDDETLLAHYCWIENDGHLVDSNGFRIFGPELWFEPIQTEIGELGVHGPVIIGLDKQSCSLLSHAFWDNAHADDPIRSPVADLIGVAPPGPLDDWHINCQSQ